jgi:hypothetical protein
VSEATKGSTTCASCGRPLAPGAAFCRGCGAPVQAAPPPPQTPTPPQVPPPPSKPPPPPPPPPPRPDQAVPPPPTPATTPAPPPRKPGRGRTILLVCLALLLVGPGVGAAIALLGGDDSKQTEAAAPGSSATVPTDEAAAPTQTGEAGAGSTGRQAGFPAVSRAAMAQEIQSLLLAYHEDVIEDRVHDAWILLSARKRAQNLRESGYAKWARAQASLAPYLTPAGIAVHVDALESDGVARVLVTGMKWSAPGSPCSEWSGLTWVKYENGNWTYDPGYSTTAERERIWKPRRPELLGATC